MLKQFFKKAVFILIKRLCRVIFFSQNLTMILEIIIIIINNVQSVTFSNYSTDLTR